jgi:hypothetical protein
MRKVFSILTVAVVLATAVYAQDFSLSAGAGGLFVIDFSGGVKHDANNSNTYPYFGGGGFAYFDATYAEVSVGFFVGNGYIVSKVNGNETKTPWTLSALTIGLLGKYPIELSDALTLFPAVGIGYDMVLSAKNKDGKPLYEKAGQDASGDFSALWLKAGAGLDVALSDKFYLRGEALFGVRLANKVENDAVDADSTWAAALGLGPTVKLGAGYKF